MPKPAKGEPAWELMNSVVVMNPDANPAAKESKMEYRRTPIYRAEHLEGSFTRVIEEQTARIPSDLFLVAALGAMAASLVFEYRENLKVSRFVGMWPAPLLIMGVYNKVVKSLGPG